ncbi:MAG: phospholipase D-like domain-containing protein [bacterium]|nr:phospholipase D-like domain-containing protein [bacterium]
MTSFRPEQFDTILNATLADGRLTRSERDALTQVIDELADDEQALALARSRVFDLAEQRAENEGARRLLRWCENVVKTIHRPRTTPGAPAAIEHAAFSPGEDCRRAIIDRIGAARGSIDVCVFTITDDRITAALEAAHRRRVALRIVSDNDKVTDLGSDIERLADAGVPTRVDRTPYHMHHKFALFDREVLLTGSYNWTVSAARDNEENLVVTSSSGLVRAFQEQFDELWSKLG